MYVVIEIQQIIFLHDRISLTEKPTSRVFSVFRPPLSTPLFFLPKSKVAVPPVSRPPLIRCFPSVITL